MKILSCCSKPSLTLFKGSEETKNDKTVQQPTAEKQTSAGKEEAKLKPQQPEKDTVEISKAPKKEEKAETEKENKKTETKEESETNKK